MEELTKLVDDGHDVDILYLDFKKAFDSVPHERLLMKLSAYGITGRIHAWIREFLTKRQHRVRVGNSYSNYSEVLSGIPQGSILGPILFTIFINDLPDSVVSICKIFADDTKIYNTADKHCEIQNDIDKLLEWSSIWNLHFNAGKCNMLHIGRKNPQCQYTMVNPISGERTVINTCNFEKDLGVTFDSNLIFDQHIQNSINKANKMIGIIKRTFMHMDKDIFSMLYKAFVRPHLEYGNIIWYPRLKRQSAALERVQRRATKLVKGIQNLSYEDRLRFLEIPTLKTRRLRGDLIQVYKIFNNIDDIPVNKFFTISHMNNTRNSTDKPPWGPGVCLPSKHC